MFDAHGQVFAIIFGSLIVIISILSYTTIVLKGMP